MKVKIIAILFLFSSYNAVKAQNTVYSVDICIYGGTSAGVIAAYAASQSGKSVLLIEPGKLLGGMTTGGLGQTDIGNKVAITGLARQFYQKVGAEYGVPEQWKFEPSVALKVMENYIRKGHVRVLMSKQICNVKKKDATIQYITVKDGDNQASPLIKVSAKEFLDCTYEGDLMAKAGVS